MGLDCSPDLPTRGSYNQFNSPATTSYLVSTYAKLSSNDYYNKISSKHRALDNPRQPVRSSVEMLLSNNTEGLSHFKNHGAQNDRLRNGWPRSIETSSRRTVG